MEAGGEPGRHAHRGGGGWVRRRLPAVLVVLGTLLSVVAIFAVWANRQLLDTENWTRTSSELLEDAAIRDQVATFLTEALYENVDVAGALREALPPVAEPLADPAAGALQDLVRRAALELLERPATQALWEQANREAHELFIEVIEGGGEVVATGGGTVTLDLGALLVELQERVGVGERLEQALPPDAARITILSSDELATAQDIVAAVEPLTILFVALALLMFALAVALARGRRREAVRGAGVGLAVAGLAVLLVRKLAGDAVVDALAATEAVRPAAESAWSIGTSMLVAVASAAVIYGVAVVVGAWTLGPTGWARALRRGLAPFLRPPHIAFGSLAVAALLLLLWAPTPGLSMLVPALILIALLVAWFLLLRRTALREHPDASLEALGRRMRARLAAIGRGRGRDAAARPPGGDPRLGDLERAARLRDAGVLEPEEFAREKARLLGAPARAADGEGSDP